MEGDTSTAPTRTQFCALHSRRDDSDAVSRGTHRAARAAGITHSGGTGLILTSLILFDELVSLFSNTLLGTVEESYKRKQNQRRTQEAHETV